MLWLSEVLLENHSLDSFEHLKDVIKDKTQSGELFFRMDVIPSFPDTPSNWEDQLEAVFTEANVLVDP